MSCRTSAHIQVEHLRVEVFDGGHVGGTEFLAVVRQLSLPALPFFYELVLPDAAADTLGPWQTRESVEDVREDGVLSVALEDKQLVAFLHLHRFR
jgi:hypothetical protein